MSQMREISSALFRIQLLYVYQRGRSLPQTFVTTQVSDNSNCQSADLRKLQKESCCFVKGWHISAASFDAGCMNEYITRMPEGNGTGQVQQVKTIQSFERKKKEIH